jgi:IS5 family transposase
LELALCDTVPDEKTIWKYREHLVQAKILDTIFDRFTRQLEEKKVITTPDMLGKKYKSAYPRGKEPVT